MRVPSGRKYPNDGSGHQNHGNVPVAVLEISEGHMEELVVRSSAWSTLAAQSRLSISRAARQTRITTIEAHGRVKFIEMGPLAREGKRQRQ